MSQSVRPGAAAPIRPAVAASDRDAEGDSEREAEREAERWRALFDGMDQAFCIVEVLLDDAGRPTDYRFLDVNAAFAAHTGLADPVGRTARELVPGLEAYWWETYGRVALTGEPARMQQGSAPMGRWFDVHAFRVGPAEARQVAILFTDVSARHAAEEALRESERRFREMADHAPVMMWVIEADATCSFVNRPWCDFTGQTPESARDGGWFEAVHPDDRGLVVRAYEAAAYGTGGAPAPFRVEYRLRRADGAWRWCIAAASPRLGDEGRLIGYIGSVVDVHDRREAEERVRSSYAELEAVYRAAPVGLCVLDADLRWVRINERLAEINGLPVEAHLGRRPSELLGPLGAEAEATLARIVATGEPVHDVELVGETPARPGVERAWIEQWIPIRGTDGAVAGVSIVAEEVTERRRQALERERLLAELDAERERLVAVFEQAPAFMAVVRGPTHVFERVNAAYYQLVGHRAIVGRPVAEALPEVVAQGFVALLDRVLATGEPFVGTGVPVQLQREPHASLEERYVDFVYAPLRDADGARAGVIVIGSDVTERVLAERAREAAHAALEAARAAAEEANRAKSQFLASMSHELRTPLNAIQGHVQLLEMELHGPVTPAQREALARVQTAQRHLLGLIEDVLNYAKLEAGKVEYRVARVPLAPVLADVAAMVEPQVRARSHTLVLDTPDAAAGALAALADEEKLRQVLLNLLSNAVKFTPPGGRITLAVEAAGAAGADGADDLVRVHVRDTGIGIPPDKQGALFAPFVQLHTGRSAFTREHAGTGLGLAISRDLAEGMGGTLGVTSEGGVGSTFTLTLRRAGPDAPSAG